MRRLRIAWVLCALAAGLLWWFLAFRLAPGLIVDALRGESLGLFNDLASRLPERPPTTYLRFWRALAWVTTGLVAFTAVTRLPPYADQARDLLCGGRTLRPREVMDLALWFGVLAGLAEGLHLTMWFLIERHPSREFDWEFAWMAAPAAAVGFAVLGAGLCLLCLLVPRRNNERPRPSLQMVTFALAFAAFCGVLTASRLLLMGPAAAILCTGLAALTSRPAGTRPDQFMKFVRRSRIPVAVITAATILLGIWTLPSVQERRRVRGLAPADADLPNIVLIILDTVRAKSLSLYGYDLPTTPNLERWAKTGVRFENAFSTAPWTLPSHASLFTGRWPHELSADYGVMLDGTHETLAERLSELGYLTVGFTGNRPNTAAATGLARGFARYEDYAIGWGPFLTRSFVTRVLIRFLPVDKSGWRLSRKSATQNTEDVLSWLPEERDRPLFLFVNYFDAHDPYISPQAYRDRFTSDVEPYWSPAGRDVTEKLVEGTRALYDAAIAYVDDEVERLLTGLRDRGVLDDAIVVIASDHGEALGEHGLLYHGNHLYTPVIKVPLVVLGPDRIPAGRVVETPVSIRDLGATIIDLATDGRESFAGRSLTPLWAGGSSSEGGALIAQLSPSWQTAWREGVLRSVVAGDHQYFLYPDGSEELYHLAADPDQRSNLVVEAGNHALVDTYRTHLDSILGTRREAVAPSTQNPSGAKR